MRVADEYSGKRAKCPGCRHGIQVPGIPQGSSQDDEGVIKFHCSHCNQKIGLPGRYAGKQVQCANCRETIRVPSVQVNKAQSPQAPKIRFNCGHCGQEFGVARKYAGRQVKCSKCGQGIVIPKIEQEPAAQVSPADEFVTKEASEQDRWAKELLAMEAAAPEAEDVLRVAPADSGDAVEQVQDFGDVRALNRGLGGGAEAYTRKSGSLLSGIGDIPLSLAASFGGALIGAIIWLAIAKATGYEMGIVAWGVGVLAGVGMTVFTDRRSAGLGVLAAVFAVCGILMGKLFVAKWVVLPLMQKEARQFEVTDEHIARFVEDPNIMFCVACLVLADNGEFEEELAWKAVAVRMSDEVQPEVEVVEETESIRRKASELLDRWSESEKRAAARTQAGRLMTKMVDIVAGTGLGLAIAFIATFSLMDILWFLMALGSAYKIGSGITQ